MKPLLFGLAALSVAGVLTGCLKPPPAPAPSAARGNETASVAPSGLPIGLPEAAVVVVAGDTLYGLTRRHRVSAEALIAANGLAPPYMLYVGQRLQLPGAARPAPAMDRNGGVYVVVAGDTLYGIARRFGVGFAALTRANGIEPPYDIRLGQRLRVPQAAQFSRREVAPARPVRSAPVSMSALPLPPGSGAGGPAPRGRPAALPQPTPAAAPAARVEPSPEVRLAAARTSAPEPVEEHLPAPPRRAGPQFHWPVEGPVVARFGPRAGIGRNDGINIAAAHGAPVRAAENGVVVYAGNELRGYGNLLLVRHDGGWTSAYAHNEELLVERGATVERGQLIARVGNTGGVSEPQSHFELRKGADAVDPLQHLAPR